MAHLLAGIRILVVEDDDDGREVLAQSLTIEGATVKAVPRASDALALLGDTDIILNFALPGDDCVWLLERVIRRSAASGPRTAPGTRSPSARRGRRR